MRCNRKSETERLKAEIEKAREELHDALEEGMYSKKVRTCSERVDQLIVCYLELQEVETLR